MFPITAIVRENGTGKSTVLKALACGYEHPTESKNNQLPIPGIGILDGDIEDSIGCIKLPGETPPEIKVFNELKAKSWK